MKYLLNVCLLLVTSISGFSQRMEASIGPDLLPKE